MTQDISSLGGERYMPLPANAPATQPATAPRAADVDDVSLAARHQAQLSAIGGVLNQVVDADTGRVVIRVISLASGEVLRQIPSEQALRLSQILQSLAEGHIDEMA